jgi:hypothetical protein
MWETMCIYDDKRSKVRYMRSYRSSLAVTNVKCECSMAKCIIRIGLAGPERKLIADVVHAGIFEMLPNILLEVNKVALVLGSYSGLAIVVG